MNLCLKISVTLERKVTVSSRLNVDYKEKGRISKRVFQESKTCQNLRKTNISYPLIRTRKLTKLLKFGVVFFCMILLQKLQAHSQIYVNGKLVNLEKAPRRQVVSALFSTKEGGK